MSGERGPQLFADIYWEDHRGRPDALCELMEIECRSAERFSTMEDLDHGVRKVKATHPDGTEVQYTMSRDEDITRRIIVTGRQWGREHMMEISTSGAASLSAPFGRRTPTTPVSPHAAGPAMDIPTATLTGVVMPDDTSLLVENVVIARTFIECDACPGNFASGQAERAACEHIMSALRGEASATFIKGAMPELAASAVSMIVPVTNSPTFYAVPVGLVRLNAATCRLQITTRRFDKRSMLGGEQTGSHHTEYIGAVAIGDTHMSIASKLGDWLKAFIEWQGDAIDCESLLHHEASHISPLDKISIIMSGICLACSSGRAIPDATFSDIPNF